MNHMGKNGLGQTVDPNSARIQRCRRCFHYRPFEDDDGTLRYVCWHPDAVCDGDSECRFFAEDGDECNQSEN